MNQGMAKPCLSLRSLGYKTGKYRLLERIVLNEALMKLWVWQFIVHFQVP